MGTRVSERTRSIRPLIAMAVVALLATVAVAAAATSLGGIRGADLFVSSSAASIPVPTAIADDSFSDCSGNLDGHVDSVGNTWTEHVGTFQCLGSDVVRARQEVSLAHASVDSGTSDDIIVTTSLTSVSSRRNRSGPGLSFLSDGYSFMYAIYERDQGRVTLGKSTLIGTTVLASSPISDVETAVLTVVIDQPGLMVLVNGSAVIAYDLTDLLRVDQDALLTNTRHGLVADDDNQSYFDTFRIEALP